MVTSNLTYGLPNKVRIMWTAGLMEPGDKWMIVTIIHLTEAPNPVVGPPTLCQPIIAPDYTFVSLFHFDRGGVRNP